MYQFSLKKLREILHVFLVVLSWLRQVFRLPKIFLLKKPALEILFLRNNIHTIGKVISILFFSTSKLIHLSINRNLRHHRGCPGLCGKVVEQGRPSVGKCSRLWWSCAFQGFNANPDTELELTEAIGSLHPHRGEHHKHPGFRATTRSGLATLTLRAAVQLESVDGFLQLFNQLAEPCALLQASEINCWRSMLSKGFPTCPSTFEGH